MHWGVPEGSYAIDPDGAGRTAEFRAMVQALHEMGLRVVLDVVYNHTFCSGAGGPRFPLLHAGAVVACPSYYARMDLPALTGVLEQDGVELLTLAPVACGET